MGPKFWRSQVNPPDLPDDIQEDPLFVKSISRAMKVISAFHQADRPLSLQEISALCGIGKSAVQRSVFTLRQLGYINRDPEDRGYIPGVRILDHSHDFQRLNPIVVKANPILLELRRATRERVDLSLHDDLRLVYASRLQSKREILSATLIGHSVPTFCTSGGWAILAHMSDAEASDILQRSDLAQRTPNTITDVDALKGKIAEAKANGFALAEAQILTGEIAIGAAVLDAEQRPVAAIHVAGSLSEWTPQEFARLFAPLLIEAARSVSRG